MANFSVQLLKGTTSTTVGVGSVECPGSGMKRFGIYDAVFGADPATLGTSSFRFELQRSTTAATGTAFTPDPCDAAEAASVTVAKSNLTVQGTNTAGKIQLTMPLNQQATARWVPQPGREIIVPASANNGLHVNTPVAGNNLQAVVHLWIEEH
jgi:hypothetical protein